MVQVRLPAHTVFRRTCITATRILPATVLVGALLFRPAVAGNLVDDLVSDARLKSSWKKAEWLNLLHYSESGDNAGHYSNDIRDPDFFLAEDGNVNPETELIATLRAIHATDANGDDHAQCRYVARLHWLIQELSIDATSLPVVSCDKYNEWRKHVRSDRVTLVFPAYHLNSPSSMFGHTLLRLDAAEDEGDSSWLSTAVNFGANVTEDDNSILYAYKGLAGGYSGIFITDHYYKKIQEYSRIEHRDIWEYRLNLTGDEIERLITHLWELQGIDFDYYYFDENCSYRLLELLEVARPGSELTDQFKLTAIPVDTVRAVETAGMIEAASYRPSQATILRYSLEQLSGDERDLVMALSKNTDSSQQTTFRELSPEQQRKIVDLAYRYLRYQQSGQERDPDAARRSHQLLLILNAYPKDLALDTTVDQPVAPERGHSSRRLTAGLGRRLDNNYAELGFRMSFHDLEDNLEGYLRGAQINIGSIQIRAEENESISLYRLDLVDIFSLTPRTGFFKPLSWRVYSGLERQFTRGVDQLTAHLTGGAGGSWNLFRSSQFYALATGRLEINKQLDRAIEPALGFSSGLLQHFRSTTARLDVSGEHFSDGIYRLRAGYTQNFVIRTNHSIRLSAQYEWQEADEFSDIQVRYQYYF
ncbi:MAG: DUF4105 domain-containing protein [Thiotrichales bacterium]|nr:MAG: DUF4105 domain-containing protein [Thiotrichales bacterium]